MQPRLRLCESSWSASLVRSLTGPYERHERAGMERATMLCAVGCTPNRGRAGWRMHGRIATIA